MTYWETFRKVDSVVIPVNNKGIMGAGLARSILPHLTSDDWDYYQCLCEDAKGGDVYFSPTERWVFAFTKENWTSGTKIQWVEKCLQGMILLGSTNSVLLCQMGCGLGGLKWESVKVLYDHYVPLMSWREVYIL